MADQITNTWVETRTKIMKMLAEAKLAAELSEDDLGEVYQLEAFLVEGARKPIQNMQQQGMLPQGGPQPMPGGGGGMPGLANGVNVDELARMLQQPSSNF